MNLAHLKYAVAVARTMSITKAAEELFMQQSNLSYAIKKLEEEIGIEIFRRTSKGMVPTARGEEFLVDARNILFDLDTMEKKYRSDELMPREFSISVPRASYISCAFVDFVKSLDRCDVIDFVYRETNSLGAINNVINNNCNLGMIRTNINQEEHNLTLLEEKGLKYELVGEFSRRILTSKDSCLAGCAELTLEDLDQAMEIIHGDPAPMRSVIHKANGEKRNSMGRSRISVFERSSQFELLQSIPDSYMWSNPIPDCLLQQYHLIQKPAPFNLSRYRDYFFYKSDYLLTDLDRGFLATVKRWANKQTEMDNVEEK